MDIPIPPSKEKNIFDYGFDAGLNRSIPDSSTGVVYDAVGDSVNAAQVLQGGNLTLKTLSIGGFIRQVAPGDDIQAAIDAVSREGGGTVQLFSDTYFVTQPLAMKSNVNLTGNGRDNSIIEFSASGARLSATSVTAWSVSDLTLRKSTTDALTALSCSNFVIKNIATTSNGVDGVSIYSCQDFSLDGVRSSLNGEDGIYIEGDTASASLVTKTFSLSNCVCTSNTGDGIDFLSLTGATGVQDFTVVECQAITNGNSGFEISQTTSSGVNGIFIGCVADTNTADGFSIASENLTFVGCDSHDNGGDGFETNSIQCKFYACSSRLNSGFAFNQNDSCVMVGCTVNYGASTSPRLQIDLDTTNATQQILANIGQSIMHETRSFQMQNKSGGGVRSGNVVVYLPSATGQEVTTTTTNGDPKVFGVVRGTYANDEYTPVQTVGHIANLYVSHGTSSIIVGDFLSTYSHAYYAKKAIAGETAFAIALEAPTTGTAIIDALLISPRLI